MMKCKNCGDDIPVGSIQMEGIQPLCVGCLVDLALGQPPKSHATAPAREKPPVVH